MFRSRWIITAATGTVSNFGVESNAPGGCSGTRVLVADDSSLVRKNVIKFLGTKFERSVVYESESVRSTIEQIDEHHPATVILDLHFPDGSGFDVLAHVKSAIPADHRPCVIVFTSFSAGGERERSIELGARHFIDKNTNIERLLDVLG